MLRDFRQHLLSPLPPPFSPKNIPTCVPPRRDGERAGAPPEQGWAGAPRERRTRGGGLGVTYSSRKISTNFPNLLELSFLTVLALPKDSSKGVASRICPWESPG